MSIKKGLCPSCYELPPPYLVWEVVRRPSCLGPPKCAEVCYGRLKQGCKGRVGGVSLWNLLGA